MSYNAATDGIYKTACYGSDQFYKLHIIDYKSNLYNFYLKNCQSYVPGWPVKTQSRSQSMPVRVLGSGMTLGKSNRNRYLIGCRDNQCCRHN